MPSNTPQRLGNPFARHRHHHSGPAILLREEPDQTSAILMAPVENPPDVPSQDNASGGSRPRPATCRNRTWLADYSEDLAQGDVDDGADDEDEGAIMVLRPRADSMPAGEDAVLLFSADADEEASFGSECSSVISMDSQSTHSDSSVNKELDRNKDIQDDLVIIDSKPFPPISTTRLNQSANRRQPTLSKPKGFVAQFSGLVDRGTKSMRGLIKSSETMQDTESTETRQPGVVSGVLSPASFQPPPPGESQFP